MVLCFVPDCNHYSERGTCKLFRFATEENEKNTWIKNIRRKDRLPSAFSRVCSCHFKDQLKSNGPTIFERNKDKILAFTSPEKKRYKRLVQEEPLISNSALWDIQLNAAIENRERSSPIQEETFLLNSSVSDLNTTIDNHERQSPLQETASVSDEQRNAANDEMSSAVQETPEFVIPVINVPRIAASDEISCTSQPAHLPDMHSRHIKTENVILGSENYFLQREIEILKERVKQLEKQPFTYNTILSSPKQHLIPYYTGIKNDEIFQIILKICTKGPIKYYADWKVECLTQEDQLLLALMKFRRNLGHEDLAVRFSVSIATVSNVILTWIHLLHEILFQKLMAQVPSQEKNKLCLPLCFNDYRNCRMVLDCTEFPTIIPKKMDEQRLFYSSYKHRNTMKTLIGIAPNGVITYMSELYPGSTSDKEIFLQSNLCNVYKPGDLILADKGFLISDLLPPQVHLNIPPFLFAPQFTPSEVIETTNIARARIHVERAIGRLKIFHITHHIPKHLFPFTTKIFQVCAALTNFNNPLLKEVEHLYNWE